MKLLLAVAIAGCYSPIPPDGAPCGEDRRCPSGQTCSTIDNRCHNNPVDPDAPRHVGDGRLDDGALDDGGGVLDAPITPIDAAPLICTPRRLLTGGVDPASQGWTIERVGTGTVAFSGTVTTLTTTNNARQLLVLRDAFPSDRWAVTLVGKVIQSGGHSAGNAAMAMMASFHDPVGDDPDRQRMLFLDGAAVGWGQGNISIGFATTSVATYRLERYVDGMGIPGIRAIIGGNQVSLSSSPFTSNGTIAIGDQSTDPGLDSKFEITSVDLACP